MAEAFFNRIAEGKAQAISAGTQPAAQINSTVVATMSEVGIEIGGQKPKLLTLCPASFVPTEDWGFDDPEGKPIEEVRQIRDEIKTKVNELARTLL